MMERLSLGIEFEVGLLNQGENWCEIMVFGRRMLEGTYRTLNKTIKNKNRIQIPGSVKPGDRFSLHR